jgi:hypothetical protein
MNLLRHPIYAIVCLGLCAWVPYGNMRGLSLWHSVGPARWFSSYGSSGISHK